MNEYQDEHAYRKRWHDARFKRGDIVKELEWNGLPLDEMAAEEITKLRAEIGRLEAENTKLKEFYRNEIGEEWQSEG